MGLDLRDDKLYSKKDRDLAASGEMTRKQNGRPANPFKGVGGMKKWLLVRSQGTQASQGFSSPKHWWGFLA